VSTNLFDLNFIENSAVSCTLIVDIFIDRHQWRVDRDFEGQSSFVKAVYRVAGLMGAGFSKKLLYKTT